MNAALWKVQRVLGVAVVYLRKRQKASSTATHANGLRISKSHNLKIIFAHLGHVRDERAHPYLLGGQTIATQAMRHTHSILLTSCSKLRARYAPGLGTESSAKNHCGSGFRHLTTDFFIIYNAWTYQTPDRMRSLTSSCITSSCTFLIYNSLPSV